jgi:hypothetical protein
MRLTFRVPLLALALAVTAPAWAETAIEIKKELLPKIKKAQAEGKDLGEAQREFEEADKLLKDGMADEALEHFRKARAAMPADAK